MRITSGGNVGIGCTDPTSINITGANYPVLQIRDGVGDGQLRVGGVGDGTVGLLLDYDNSGFTTTTIRSLYGATSNDAALNIDAGYITFRTGTSFSERMRITSGGNLLIGTTTDAGQKLQVNGSVKIPVASTYNSGSNAIKSTDSIVVTTTPTIIYTSQQVGSVESGNLVLVTGVISGTGSNFVDLVLFITNGSAIVVQQQSISSPAARTYAVSGTSLTLTMASGNYVVGTGGFIQGYNLSF